MPSYNEYLSKERAKRSPTQQKKKPGNLTSKSQFEQRLDALAERDTKRKLNAPPSGGHSLADYGNRFGRGAGLFAQSAATLADYTTGGATERASEKHLGRSLRDIGRDVTEHYTEKLSPAMAESMNKVYFNDDWSLGEAWTDPHAVGGTITESMALSMPGMGAAGAISRAGAAALGRQAITKGLSREAVRQARVKGATIGGAVGGGAFEGATAGGLVGDNVETELRAHPEEVQNSPYYQNLIAQGAQPQDAFERTIRDFAKSAGLKSGAATGLISTLFGAYFGRLLEGKGTGRAAEGLKGAGLESSTEFLQGANEQLQEQLATTAITGKPISGPAIANEAVAGSLAGGTQGGVTGLLTGAPSGPVDRANRSANPDAGLTPPPGVQQNAQFDPDRRTAVPDSEGPVAAPNEWSPAFNPLPDEQPEQAPSQDKPEEAPEQPEQSAPKFDPEANDPLPGTTGSKVEVASPGNRRRIEAQYGIAPIDDVIASNDPDGRINPAYAQDLQPRDRTRSGMRNYLQEMLAKFAPDMLGESVLSSEGAPIVNGQGMVESGNGRHALLQLAYAMEQSPELKDVALEEAEAGNIDATPEEIDGLQSQAYRYRQFLKQNAEKFGLDPAAVDQMRSPLLYRQRLTPMSRDDVIAFTEEANQSTAAALSAPEQARKDAEKLDERFMDMLDVSADGDVLAPKNHNFWSNFIGGIIPASEHNLYVSGGKRVGEPQRPTDLLRTRIQSALFAKAYNDDRLINTYTEQSSDEDKVIVKGLMIAAPEMAKAASLPDPFLGFGLDKAVTDAVDLFNAAKGGRDAMTVAEHLKIRDLHEAQPSPVTVALARFIEDSRRSSKRIGGVIEALAQALNAAHVASSQPGLLGDTVELTYATLAQRANEWLKKEYGDDTKTIETEGLVEQPAETSNEPAGETAETGAEPEGDGETGSGGDREDPGGNADDRVGERAEADEEVADEAESKFDRTKREELEVEAKSAATMLPLNTLDDVRKRQGDEFVKKHSYGPRKKKLTARRLVSGDLRKASVAAIRERTGKLHRHSEKMALFKSATNVRPVDLLSDILNLSVKQSTSTGDQRANLARMLDELFVVAHSAIEHNTEGFADYVAELRGEQQADISEDTSLQEDAESSAETGTSGESVEDKKPRDPNQPGWISDQDELADNFIKDNRTPEEIAADEARKAAQEQGIIEALAAADGVAEKLANKDVVELGDIARFIASAEHIEGSFGTDWVIRNLDRIKEAVQARQPDPAQQARIQAAGAAIHDAIITSGAKSIEDVRAAFEKAKAAELKAAEGDPAVMAAIAQQELDDAAAGALIEEIERRNPPAKLQRDNGYGVVIRRAHDGKEAAMALKDEKKFVKAIKDTVKRAALMDTLSPDASGALTELHAAVTNSIKHFGDWMTGRDWRTFRRMKADDAIMKARNEGTLEDYMDEYIALVSGVAKLFDGKRTIRDFLDGYDDLKKGEMDEADAPAAVLNNAYRKNLNTQSSGNAFWRLRQKEMRYGILYPFRDRLDEADPPKADAGTKTGGRKKLLREKRDNLRREGFDRKIPAEIKSEDFKTTFGFASVTPGKWVTAAEQQFHYQRAFEAFYDFADLLGIDPKMMSLGGKLHLGFGATGQGKHAAHYHAATETEDAGRVQSINFTKTKGDGTVAHEWFHALDHNLRTGGVLSQELPAPVRDIVKLARYQSIGEGGMQRYMLAFAKGSLRWTNMGRHADRWAHVRYTIDRLRQNVDSVRKSDHLSTQYNKLIRLSPFYDAAIALDKGKGKKYWSTGVEMFARLGEAWVYDRLAEQGKTNDYLVNDWVAAGKVSKDTGYRGMPYPTAEEREALWPLFDRLFKDHLTWDAERGPSLREYDREFADELADQISSEFKSAVAATPRNQAQLEEHEASELEEEAEAVAPAEDPQDGGTLKMADAANMTEEELLEAVYNIADSRDEELSENRQDDPAEDQPASKPKSSGGQKKSSGSKKAAPKPGDHLARAAKHGFSATSEALDGLATLFGGKGGSLNTFGGIDEQRYQQALPHFKAALTELLEAGREFGDFVEAMLDIFGRAIAPYVVRFVSDIKSGEVTLEDSNGNDLLDASRTAGGSADDLRSKTPQPESADATATGSGAGEQDQDAGGRGNAGGPEADTGSSTAAEGARGERDSGAGGRADGAGTGRAGESAAAEEGRAGRGEGPVRERAADGARVPAGGSGLASEFQSDYQPESEGANEGILAPKNIAEGMSAALKRIKAEVGSIDQFVADELQYDSIESMQGSLFGLQIDAVAASIHAMKNGNAIVIADQTGVGKGRQAAALLRWARLHGKTPVFVTEKANLFKDMAGDLTDIGEQPRPFIMNDDKKASSMTSKTRAAGLKQMADKAALPAGYDYLFMTYSQLNSGLKSDKRNDGLKGAQMHSPQRDALRALAPNAVMILDEAHNAAGSSTTFSIMNEVTTEASGVTYLSATYAKRADNIAIYHRTGLRHAAENVDALTKIVRRGGPAIQTVISDMLARAGQLFRRERSFKGIETLNVIDEANLERHKVVSDLSNEVVRDAILLDMMLEGERQAYVDNQHPPQPGDSPTQLERGHWTHLPVDDQTTGIMGQLMLSMKADAAADRAIELLTKAREFKIPEERGGGTIKDTAKVFLAIENTMSAMMESWAESRDLLQDGADISGMSYKDMLESVVDRARRFTIYPPGDGGKYSVLMPPDAMSADTLAVYQRILKRIKDADLADMPASPIDHIRKRIEDAGFKVGELTGRKWRRDEHTGKLTRRTKDELDRNALLDRFNNSDVDVIIANRAGSTGLSAHASERFKNQKPRAMIVAQPSLDINVFMQFMGRINRTGQVVLPRFELLQTALPSETRPSAVLSRKLKSLNANVSASIDSDVSLDAVDFFNHHGNKIVTDWLHDNQAAVQMMRLDMDNLQADTAYAVAGKAMLLPYEMQKQFFEEVTEAYTNHINYLNTIGRNDLDVTLLDLDATTMAKQKVDAGDPSVPVFGEPAYIEKVKVKVLREAPTGQEVVEDVRQAQQEISLDQRIDDLLSHARKQAETREQPLVDALEKERAKAKPSAERIAKLEDELGSLRTDHTLAENDARNVLGQFRMGSVVNLDVDGEKVKAVIYRMAYRKVEGGNPFSAGRFHIGLRVANAMGRTSMSVPKMLRDASPPKVATLDRIQQIFDEATAGSDKFELRYMFTGNLLPAIPKMDKKQHFQVVRYTTDSGKVRNGLLMPKSYEPKAYPEVSRHQIATADDLVKVFSDPESDWSRARLVGGNSDNRVRVLPSSKYPGGLMMIFEGGRGSLSTDPKLEQANGYKAFKARNGNTMMVTREPSRVPGVLGVLQQNLTFTVDDSVAQRLNLQAPAFNDTLEGDVPNTQRREPRGFGFAKGEFVVGEATEAGPEVSRVAQFVAEQTGFVPDVRPVFIKPGLRNLRLRRRIRFIEKAFGKRVVLYSSKDPAAALGLNFPSMPDVILANIENNPSLEYTIGHELLHSLRKKDEGFYQHILSTVMNVLKQTGWQNFVIEQRERSEFAGHWEETDDRMREELIADAFANMLEEPGFIAELKARLAPSAWHEFAYEVRAFLERLVARVRKLKENPWFAEHITDVERLRDSIQSAILNGGRPPRGPDYGRTGQMEYGASFDLEEENLWWRVVRRTQNQFVRFKRAQQAIQRAGGEVREEADVELAESTFMGAAAEELRQLNDTYVRPIVERLGKLNLTIDDFDAFLYARHAKERNDHIASINPRFREAGIPGSGMTDQEAGDVMQEFRDRGVYDELHTLAALVDDMNEARLDLLVESGLETEENVESWRSRYKHYVPLKGGNSSRIERLKIGRGFSTGGKNIIAAFGRRSQADSPFMNAYLQAQQVAIKAEKQKVGVALYNLVADHHNQDVWEFVSVPGGRERPVWNPETEQVEYTADQRLPDRTVQVKIDGKLKYIRLKDDLLWRAWERLGVDEMDALTRVMAKLNRWLSTVNTSLNPEFVISNAFRDFQTAIHAVLSESDIGHFKGGDQKKIVKDMMKNYGKALRGIYDVLNAERKGTPEPSGYWQGLFRKYRESGAMTGYFDMKGLEDTKREAERMVAEAAGGKKGAMLKALRHAKDVVSNINAVVENAVRLLAFQYAYEQAGLSEKRAAQIARNLTVNFNRKGELGTTMNAFYLFYNAGMQGSAQFVKVMRSPLLQKIAVGTAVTAFMIAEANRLASGEDDDGENYYDLIDNSLLERNLVLMLPGTDGKTLEIPLPYGYNIFHVVGTQLNRMVHGQDIGTTMLSIVRAAATSFIPISTDSSEDGETFVLKLLSPTATDPFVELVANENAFGAPIKKEQSPYDDNPIPASHLPMASTGALWQEVAMALNSWTGGSPFRAGAVDISPDTMEHLFEFMLGGTGQFTSRLITLGEKAVTGDLDDLTVDDVPFLRRVMGAPADWVHVRRYYDAKKMIAAAKDERKGQARLPLDQRTPLPDDLKKALMLSGRLKATENRLQALYKRRRKLITNTTMTERAKEAELDRIEKQIHAEQKRFGAAYDRAMK